MKVIAKLDSKLRISCYRRQTHLRACQAMVGDMKRCSWTKSYGVLNCHHVTYAPSVILSIFFLVRLAMVRRIVLFIINDSSLCSLFFFCTIIHES